MRIYRYFCVVDIIVNAIWSCVDKCERQQTRCPNYLYISVHGLCRHQSSLSTHFISMMGRERIHPKHFNCSSLNNSLVYCKPTTLIFFYNWIRSISQPSRNCKINYSEKVCDIHTVDPFDSKLWNLITQKVIKHGKVKFNWHENRSSWFTNIYLIKKRFGKF